jgi:hypothetical protein
MSAPAYSYAADCGRLQSAPLVQRRDPRGRASTKGHGSSGAKALLSYHLSVRPAGDAVMDRLGGCLRPARWMLRPSS